MQKGSIPGFLPPFQCSAVRGCYLGFRRSGSTLGYIPIAASRLFGPAAKRDPGPNAKRDAGRSAKRDAGRNAGARANALPLRFIASHLGQPSYRFIECLGDSGGGGSAWERMIFERLPGGEKAHRFGIEFRGDVL